MSALDTAKQIKLLLAEQGIENDSLETFINQVQNLPSSENLERYNGLVYDYESASGYADKSAKARELINFYNAHSEEFATKEGEIKELERLLTLNDELEARFTQLYREIGEGSYK